MASRAPTNPTWCRAAVPTQCLSRSCCQCRCAPSACQSVSKPHIYLRWASRRDSRWNSEWPTKDKWALRGANSSRTKSSRRATNDGSNAVVQPPGGSGPGVWIPTPPAFLPYLLPQWGFVVPFAMSSSSQFRPPGPPALDSQQYAADYEEVKQLGAAVGSTRTEDQTEIALFWADGAGTETPPGHWNSIAQIIGAAQGNTLEENARLFALLNIAMADAAICSWDAKYTFDFWRPVTAIAFAEPELKWMSFIVTPPFPDYTSGHSTFSAAAATVLPLFFGTEDLPFTTGSDFLPGVFRSFSTCQDAAEEAALSRIYGGIHFRFGKRGRIASWEQYRRMDRYPLPAAQRKSFAVTR